MIIRNLAFEMMSKILIDAEFFMIKSSSWRMTSTKITINYTKNEFLLETKNSMMNRLGYNLGDASFVLRGF